MAEPTNTHPDAALYQDQGDASYYLLELRKVPLATWSVCSKAQDWYACFSSTAGQEGFPQNSLGRLQRCPLWIQLERCCFYILYVVTVNLLPWSIPALPFLRIFSCFPSLQQFISLVVLQVVLMRVLFKYWGRALAWARGHVRQKPSSRCAAQFQLEQMFELERQDHEYFSTRYVLPRSIVCEKALVPAIVVVAPHGVLPLGVGGALHRILGGRTTRFGVAPALFKVWGISKLLCRLGFFPAGKRGIANCLAGGDHAGLILDGIPGMFHTTKGNGDEELWLLQRKAICAIALRAGCPIIPAYCFGTNEIWRVVDPLFGLLRFLSTRLDVALAPFCGRWWLPFGPPSRRPLVLCFGDPIPCSGSIEKPTQHDVDAKHLEMIEAFRDIFNTHKAAYGRPDAKIRFV